MMPEAESGENVVKGVVRILGIRGVPAAHGGFETFAERLSLYLVARRWRVVVYCQESGAGTPYSDVWQGIERIRIPVRQTGPAGTIEFDWKATMHAARSGDLCLTLGYNTAIFNALARLRGSRTIINMDGIEWARPKWGALAKTWLRLNERVACMTAHHLVADHPEIQRHLEEIVSGNKVTMIPYGADEINETSDEPVKQLGLEPGKFISVVARPEPENSVLEIVRGFSAERRGCRLAVIGNYCAGNSYQRAVLAAASDEVSFPGAIYETTALRALRYYSVAYAHGHQVGGTNPSLVEAMGAGNAILAHDNRFNRWVAGKSALYFSDAQTFSEKVTTLLMNDNILQELRTHGRVRFRELFTWPQILAQYEALLLQHPATKNAASRHTAD